LLGGGCNEWDRDALLGKEGGPQLCTGFRDQEPYGNTPQALRQFVIDYVERIDFRRVDKFSLVRLLVLSQRE
jgi:hypothetical protein